MEKRKLLFNGKIIKVIAKIPNNALPYCMITRYDGFLCVGWDFDKGVNYEKD